MSVSQHGPNLTQITIMAIANCYLVREQDGLTLIDAGASARSADTISLVAEALEAQITRIAITHTHADHIGALAVLRERLPVAEIALCPWQVALLAGHKMPRKGQPLPPAPELNMSQTPATRLLADGDMLGSLRVVAVPGHSPGHAAFYDTRDGGLLCGDAIYTAGGITVAGVFNWRFPFPSMATWDKDQALESAMRMRTLKPAYLASGHGPIVDDPLDALDRSIAKGQHSHQRRA